MKSISKSALLDFFLIIISIAAYHFFFWNKDFGLQDGWGNTYAALISQGKIIYRDFYFFSQPITLLLSHTLTSLFGNTIITLRTYGVCERVFMACLLYLIYHRITKRSIALIACITSTIFYTGTTLDVIYEYVQTCLLFILISTYFLSTYIDTGKKHLLFVAGFFGGLAFLTKQTTGLLIPFSMMFFLVIFDSNQKKRVNCRSAIYYLAAFLIPSMICFAIFYHMGIFSDYINQVFFSAANSKGGIKTVTLGAITRTYKYLLGPIVIPISLVALFARQENSFALQRKELFSFLRPTIIVIVALVIASSVLTYFDADSFTERYFTNKIYFLFIIYGTFILLSFYLIFKSFLTLLKPYQAHWLLLSLLSVSIIYTQGLSFSYSVYSLLLSFGLMLILLFSLKTPFNPLKNSLLYLVCLIAISMTLIQHYFWPYEWWGWKSPSLKTAVTSSTLKPLIGLKLAPYSQELFTNITAKIQENSKPNDSIFIFPHMPIFYLLSNRYPSTRAIVNYFDVCSDECAQKDAQIILKNPPKVIVIETFPDKVWLAHEDFFRQGKKSGQRDIVDSINTLIQRYHYKLAASYPSTVSKFIIEVWVKP